MSAPGSVTPFGEDFMKIAVTGGSGFIGANFLKLMVPRHPRHQFFNLDKLTYAANPLSIKELENFPNYSFHHVDLADAGAVFPLLRDIVPDRVVHFAAESHVDRSILGPADFIQSNIVGTFNLLEACRDTWSSPEDKVFHHISTDEVYGSLGPTGSFTERSRYDPSSPYSASKAAGDHLVNAYWKTFGLPVKISNCSNNYGPFQFPEKLIPLMILNALEGNPLPVYGDGRNVRDWLYVTDHCEAVWLVMEHGRTGETYNIGGFGERSNNEVVRHICREVAAQTGRPAAELESLITHVPDRPGHDRRYAINSDKLQKELGWKPAETFASGLSRTVRWYRENQEWVDMVRTGEYRQWIVRNYDQRAGGR
jgi:dTDP-glucose 4,6-dehydratase